MARQLNEEVVRIRGLYDMHESMCLCAFMCVCACEDCESAAERTRACGVY